MAQPLPKLIDRRRTKQAAAFAASLSDQEREVLAILTERKARLSVFGRPGGDAVVVSRIASFTPKRQTPRIENDRREDLAPVVSGLRKSGWLRFADHSLPGDKPLGYFFLTDTAEWVLENA